MPVCVRVTLNIKFSWATLAMKFLSYIDRRFQKQPNRVQNILKCANSSKIESQKFSQNQLYDESYLLMHVIQSREVEIELE